MSLKLPKNYLSQNIFFLKLAIQYPVLSPDSWTFTRILVRLYQVAISANVVIMWLSLMKVVYDQSTDVTIDIIEFIENIFVLIQELLASVFMIYMMVQASYFKEMSEYLDQNFRFVLTNSYENIDVLKAYRKVNRIAVGVNLVYILSVASFAVSKVYGLENGHRKFVISVHYPFDVYATPNYELVLIFQLLNQCIISLMYGNMDTLYVNLAIMILHQFEILQVSLKNISYTAMLRCGIPKWKVDEFARNFNGGGGNTLKGTEFETKYEEEMEKILKDCVRHHQVIFNFCDQVENYYSPILVLKVFASSTVTCLITFLMTLVQRDDIFRLVNILNYFLLINAELFCYGYFSTMATLGSMKIRDFFYESPWYLTSPRFRKLMQFFLLRTSKPIRFTAGKLYTISIETYMMILKASVSLFTVLRIFQEKAARDELLSE